MDGFSTLLTRLHNPQLVGAPFEDYLSAAESIPAEVAADGYARLKAFAESIGGTVTEEPPVGQSETSDPRTSGMTFFDTRTIWIRPTLSIQNKFQTLLHELAHVADSQRDMLMSMFDERYSQAIGELVAEGVVWVVNNQKGWPTRRAELYLGNNFRNAPKGWVDAQLLAVRKRIEHIANDLILVIDGSAVALQAA